MPFKLIARFIKLMNSNTRLAHLATGAAFGVLLALIPAGSLFWIAIFLLLCLTKINYAFQLAVMSLLKLLSPLYIEALDSFGLWILTLPSLEPFFLRLANIPLFWLTRFNNSLVAGGLVAGIILLVPTALVFGLLIWFYRLKLEPVFVKSKLAGKIKKIPLVVKIAKYVAED